MSLAPYEILPLRYLSSCCWILILLNKYYCCCPSTTPGRSRLDAVLILHKNRALASVPAIRCNRCRLLLQPLSYGVSQSERRLLSCLWSALSGEAMGVSSRHFLTILAHKLANRAPVDAPCVFSRVPFSLLTSKSCSRCGAVHILGIHLALVTAYWGQLALRPPAGQRQVL